MRRGLVDKRAWFRRGCARQRRRARSRPGCPLLPDRLVEPLGVGVRPDAQLVLQRIAAHLVLLERQRRLAMLGVDPRSEEHTSELQSLRHLVCRLLLEKKKKT